MHRRRKPEIEPDGDRRADRRRKSKIGCEVELEGRRQRKLERDQKGKPESGPLTRVEGRLEGNTGEFNGR